MANDDSSRSCYEAADLSEVLDKIAAIRKHAERQEKVGETILRISRETRQKTAQLHEGDQQPGGHSRLPLACGAPGYGPPKRPSVVNLEETESRRKLGESSSASAPLERALASKKMPRSVVKRPK